MSWHSKCTYENDIVCKCRGVFEQLGRYTMRYQVYDLHLGINLNLNLLIRLLFSILTLNHFNWSKSSDR